MRVAVIGGGVGGLALALGLVRNGIEVSVHERVSDVREVGNGLGLASNGRRILSAWGVESDLLRAGAVISSMRLLGESGDDHLSYDVGTGGLLGIRRADLTRVLAAALPSGVVRRGRECVGVCSVDAVATARFADGTAIEADVIVGADGLHSAVARGFPGRPRLRESEQVVLRGFATTAGLELPSGTQLLWTGADRHFLTYPVGGDENVAAGFVPRNAVDPLLPESAQMRSAFVGWDMAVEALVDRTVSVARLEIADRDPFSPWSCGRVGLLGDAAHSMVPHAGQGANQALEDAAVLAAVLSTGESNGRDAIAERLVAYERARRPRTTRVQRRSRSNGAMFSGDRTAARGAPDEADLSWLYAYDALAAGREAAAGLERR